MIGSAETIVDFDETSFVNMVDLIGWTEYDILYFISDILLVKMDLFS